MEEEQPVTITHIFWLFLVIFWLFSVIGWRSGEEAGRTTYVINLRQLLQTQSYEIMLYYSLYYIIMN